MKTFNAGFAGHLEIGPEKTEVVNDDCSIAFDEPHIGMRAFSGTLFDPDNPQHTIGSDGMRYAIGIQMARDRRDYAVADGIRAKVERDYRIEQTRNHTTLYWREVI